MDILFNITTKLSCIIFWLYSWSLLDAQVDELRSQQPAASSASGGLPIMVLAAAAGGAIVLILIIVIIVVVRRRRRFEFAKIVSIADLINI